jgi:outer membrane protein OmpA-like peptidoglycan-associated protein
VKYTPVSGGSEQKIKGIIASRNTESLLMRGINSSDIYYVEVSPGTTVRTSKKGVFRGGKEYAASYLLRGLRIEVKGTGNADGHLVSREITFDEDDLRTAQALEVRVDPVEAQGAENAVNVTAAQKSADKAQNSADKAQSSADSAMTEAERANNRINGLGEYDLAKTITVPFATGSFTLGPKGRGIIDEAAAWVKTQDTKGWMVAVVGYADSSGSTLKNKTLSEKRANGVIGYLVGKHNLPLTRLIQPFGAGVDQPVATNATEEGRSLNRRVEIRLLINKGIAGK